MDRGRHRLLYRIEVAAAAVSALLFVLTLIEPQWIETLFDAAPDNGDGSLERWFVLASSFVVAVIATSLARRERRLLRAFEQQR